MKLRKKYIKKSVVLLVAAALVCAPIDVMLMSSDIVYAEEAKVKSISASYSGGNVLVGEEIDRTKLTVTVTYENGTSEEIKDYTLTSTKVAEEGLNLMMVIYQGKTANFYVYGKKITSMAVNYSGMPLSVGNSVSKKDIKVFASFTDGSSGEVKDFKILDGEIKSVGENVIHISCNGQVLKQSVYGIAPKTVAALFATYNGNKVTVGSSINPDDLIVTATYKDGSSEVINNYVLVPAVIGTTGTQNVTANYQGHTVSFNVEGIAKEIKEISAKYVGGPIGVGYSVHPNAVEVTATYNDGSKGKITEFNLLGGSITYVGYHIVTVEAAGCKAEFIVQGVEQQKIDFTNSCEFKITNGKNTGKVTISLPGHIDKTHIKGKEVASAAVSKIVSRAIKKSNYIAFEIEAVNEAVEEEFPMVMKIEIPKEYKLADTVLFYTPNRKSVIGQLNTDPLTPDIIVATIYNPGTYILSYKPETK